MAIVDHEVGQEWCKPAGTHRGGGARGGAGGRGLVPGLRGGSEAEGGWPG